MSDPAFIAEADAGTLRGMDAGQGVACWLGIPFAAPPVGPLRWRAPQALSRWSGIRDARRFGDACPQEHVPDDSLMRQFSFASPTPECGMSEDCLTLNVWAPAAPQRALPVIVFLHGGGHRHGAGSHPVSNGALLAAAGAVVVTVNYRLGAFGYLAHPALTAESGASGHWALLDVIAALQWVQRNIAAFGGDAHQVALFGQSAGAAMVNVLMASPRAQGLFQRAIVHSAGRLRGAPPMGAPMKTLEEAERDGAAWAGDARTADALRAMDPLATPAARGAWGPIVDRHVLPEPVDATFQRGAQLQVPLLAGFTSDEASGFATPELHTPAAFLLHLRRQFPRAADALFDLYQVHDDASATSAAYRLRRDSVFAFQPWRLARLHARTGRQPVHLFEFAHSPPMPAHLRWREPPPPAGYGAFHGSELWYVFGNQHLQAWAWDARDRELARRMMRAWIAFAATGSPSHDAGPAWPEFSAGGQCLRWSHVPAAHAPSNATALHLIESTLE